MPVMGGAETLRELTQRAPRLPVLASTGYSEAEAMRRFGRDGLAGFMQKPYTPARLAEAIRSILSRQTSAQAQAG